MFACRGLPRSYLDDIIGAGKVGVWHALQVCKNNPTVSPSAAVRTTAKQFMFYRADKERMLLGRLTYGVYSKMTKLLLAAEKKKGSPLTLEEKIKAISDSRSKASITQAKKRLTPKTFVDINTCLGFSQMSVIKFVPCENDIYQRKNRYEDMLITRIDSRTYHGWIDQLPRVQGNSLRKHIKNGYTGLSASEKTNLQIARLRMRGLSVRNIKFSEMKAAYKMRPHGQTPWQFWKEFADKKNVSHNTRRYG